MKRHMMAVALIALTACSQIGNPRKSDGELLKPIGGLNGEYDLILFSTSSSHRSGLLRLVFHSDGQITGQWDLGGPESGEIDYGKLRSVEFPDTESATYFFDIHFGIVDDGYSLWGVMDRDVRKAAGHWSHTGFALETRGAFLLEAKP